MKENKTDLMAKYRVSGKRIRQELKRLEQAKIRAFQRYLEKELEMEKMEIIDGRRDW